MKILVTEIQPEKGHKKLFKKICELLRAEGHEVVAIVPKNSDVQLDGCVIRYTPYNYYADQIKKNTTFKRITYSVKVMSYIRQIIKVVKPDAYFIVTYDELPLAMFGGLLFNKKRLFIMHHHNIDRVEGTTIRKAAFRIILNTYNSVVQTAYMKEYICFNYYINKDKVLIAPHPLNPVEITNDLQYDCVGLSNTNDDKIIEKLIQEEEEYSVLKTKGMHIVLKSKKYEYDNGFLKVIKGYIKDDEYNDFIKKAKTIFMPFPLSFRNRMSGTLIDALTNKKTVISTNIPLIEACSKSYPNIVKIYNPNTFVDDVQKLGLKDVLKDLEYEKFAQEHSDNLLAKLLSDGIHNMILGEKITDRADF